MHACSHLGMNGRLTFSTVSTVRSSFIQIGTPPPPIFIHSCSSSLLISSTDANEAETAVLGMDKIPHWLQNASSQRWEYWIPRHQNYPRIQYGRRKNTHSYSRHIGWEIPGKKKKPRHSNEMRLCLFGLWREKRGRVTQKKERATPLYTPSFFCSLPPFPSSPAPSDPHLPASPPAHPARAHTHAHFHYSMLSLGATRRLD